ncbi:hypothetical protein FSARC_11665 [Fusarium sarcochroum]|uniref:AB hydrolase-1 domain-containing protein n=1 Tax=Fusarium sarcochroum TaxID=1208366 RepID=A0A8H4WZW5_9HYPO|nr:hypothetical protein FSARC_11665 [Fusarium sarcochroum]
MPFATTDDGHEIWFEEHGTEGPIIVFVSGFMGIANIWEPLTTELDGKFRFIAYDSRGFGRSSKPESPESYSVPRHAVDLATVLDTLKISEPVVLVAHSMGGNIASAYYLEHPDHVAGIVYSGTYYDGKLFSHLGVTLEAFAGMAESPAKCADFYVNFGLPYNIALEAAKWPAYARRNNAKILLEYEMGDRYTEIKIPTLGVQGDRDVVTPPETTAKIVAEALPQNTKLAVLKDVNHFPQVEATEVFGHLVEEFGSQLSF